MSCRVAVILLTVAVVFANADIPQVPDVPLNNCGTPAETFISWSDVRKYLVKELNKNIQGSVYGPALPVMRCGNCLTPCHAPDTYCGAKLQRYTTKSLPLRSNSKPGGIGMELVLTYLEDEKCQCVNKRTYNKFFNRDISAVPPIIRATIQIAEEKNSI